MAMNQNAIRVIRVTPTVTGVQYANNDILFDTTEVPLAVGKKGECSKLVSAMIKVWRLNPIGPSKQGRFPHG